MWIDARARPPTREDADAYGCVIVWHALQGPMITGWHQIQANRFMTHWMPTPAPPKKD